MPPSISIIVCTHNPKATVFKRTIDALKLQTHPQSTTELIVIDNCSSTPVADRWDLSWHPNARHVYESKLGSGFAKIRGIRESSGDLLLYVDDDNVLAPNYVGKLADLASKMPFIGAFGASTVGEFESPPRQCVRRYLPFLAVHEINEDYWGNEGLGSKSLPFGAGLGVRRPVAEQYLLAVKADPRRESLGRVGTQLGCNEDVDLALCAIDIGLGIGRFHELRLTHLIPATRLTDDYIARIVGSNPASGKILRHIRGIPETNNKNSLKKKLRRLVWRATLPKLERMIEKVTAEQELLAREFLASSSPGLPDHQLPPPSKAQAQVGSTN